MLKGGLVGFGRMGITHYSILNTHPVVEFVAVCESSKFMAQNLSRHTPVRVFSEYEKMFDEVEMDFVIIATPTASHAEVVEAAMALHEAHGPARTTVTQIAERAGVGRLTVYRHFPDETALLWACSGLYWECNPFPDPEPLRAVADPTERRRQARVTTRWSA